MPYAEGSKWLKAGKIDKRRIRGELCISRLQSDAMNLGVRSVSNYAVSPATDKYLRKEYTKAARKKNKEMSKKYFDSCVAMYWLNSSPVVLDEAEDFYLYIREGEV